MSRLMSNKRIITQERKVTIPEGLGLNPDDAIEFIVSKDGTIIIKKLEWIKMLQMKNKIWKSTSEGYSEIYRQKLMENYYDKKWKYSSIKWRWVKEYIL